MAGRNPPWTVEEIILATEVYINNERRVVGPNHPDVIALSKLLNDLTIHPLDLRNEKFRNPEGVGLKLRNIRSVDPEWQGAASHSSHLDDYFWRVLGGQEGTLRTAASAIRAKYAPKGSQR